MPKTPTRLFVTGLGGYPNFTPLYENAGYAVASRVAVPLAPVWAGIGYAPGRRREALRAQAAPPEKGR